MLAVNTPEIPASGHCPVGCGIYGVRWEHAESTRDASNGECEEEVRQVDCPNFPIVQVQQSAWPVEARDHANGAD